LLNSRAKSANVDHATERMVFENLAVEPSAISFQPSAKRTLRASNARGTHKIQQNSPEFCTAAIAHEA
jgi:hypothetical protein